MIFKIEAKKSLYINEWQATIINDLSYDIMVDLGHTELMVKTITIKEEMEIPKAFRES
ncbi:hypothetical protein ES703_114064 [subsurface metagenome]